MVNKKHIFVPITIVCILVLSMGIVLSGCTNNEGNRTPMDIIKGEYGDKVFNISFNSETLDNPIEDMEYTANKIVKIPTPQKVGYIFEGWFFDKDFLMPYSDGALMLMMQDVTLYPKWSKEKFVHNGTYDIEFSTSIVEGSVKKGERTDEFGGFRDFGDALVKDACLIEKSDKDLLLKLQFDTQTVIPFNAAHKVFDVAISECMGSNIYITNSIDSKSEPMKTIFIKINDLDLSDTLYLDITWCNYLSEGVNDLNRSDTITKYQIAFDFTKIIGFSEAFADINESLSEGYYIAKSYFRKEDNGESMGSVFNPVYSYVYSDGNKNYKLIKQNMPYLGLVAENKPLLMPLQNNFYEPLTCFVATTMAFDIDVKDKQTITQSKYYPATYNGGYYRNSVTEFHADTGKFYNIIDLDKDLTKEYLALTAISGYMERENGMGYIRQILSIDYDNLIKIPECDYAPLEGDCYEYQDSFSFYPGDYRDLNQKDLTIGAIEKYGMSIEMPNFFYSAPTMSSPINDRKIYSSRIEVVPTAQTNAKKVSQSRNLLAEFTTNTRVYGYEETEDNKLFLDRMSPQSFEGAGYNNMLRDTREVVTGRNCVMGEVIKLENLFKDKISLTVPFNEVSYKAFDLKGNKIEINNAQLQFTKDMYIEFTYDTGNGISKTKCYLKNLGDPVVTELVDTHDWSYAGNNTYTKTMVDKVGETVVYPRVSYKWGSHSVKLVDKFYGSNNVLSINPSKAMIFNLDDGYSKLDLPLSHTSSFVLMNKNVRLMYELNNEFNERTFISFDYISDPKAAYVIKDKDSDEILVDRDVKFREKDHSRINVNETVTRGIAYDSFDESIFKSYTHTENGVIEDYDFLYYNINSNNGTKLGCIPSGNKMDMVNEVNNYLKDKEFGSVSQIYRHNEDYLTVNYLYKVSFGGGESFSSLNNETYFTNTPYYFAKNELFGSNREQISSLRINIEKYINGRPSPVYEDIYDRTIEDDGHQYKITFKAPGTYKLTATYYVDTTIMGDTSSSSEKYIFTQMLNVKSNVSDIKIIYKTDRYHPFNDGSIEKEIVYNLNTSFQFMPFNKTYFDLSLFAKDNNIYPYDRSHDSLFTWSTTGDLSGKCFKPTDRMTGKEFIKLFNTDKLVLTAVWENRFKVTLTEYDNTTVVTANIDELYDKYYIELPQNVSAPHGKRFIGWSGGFIGSSIIKGEKAYLPYVVDYYDKEKYPSSFFEIHAVYEEVNP